jgi:hypothetical protein
MTSSDIEIKLKRLNKKICCVSTDLNNLLSEDIVDALENATNPSLTNVFLTEENLNNYLSQDILDALQAATTPTLANPYATMLDLMGIEPGTLITVVANYSALPPPATVTGKFYWTEASQGIEWLPGNWGGTYYGKGMYYSNGVTWEPIPVPFQATQAEVNTGTNNDRFVTPLTLKMSTQWDGVVLLAGRAGGQTVIGGTGVGENLTLMSNGSGTKGNINFGTSRYDEVNNRLYFGAATGTGRINLPDSGTTSADGISFGTNVSLFRNGSGVLEFAGIELRTVGGAYMRTPYIYNNTTYTQGIRLSSPDIQLFSPGGISILPSTLTGSQATSALSISQTWNTTGNPTAILLDVTNTASGANAKLMDLKVGGVSILDTRLNRVHVGSGTTFVGNETTPALLLGSTLNNGFYVDSNRVAVRSGGQVTGMFTSTGFVGGQGLFSNTTANNLTTPIYIPYRITSQGLTSGLTGNSAGAISLVTNNVSRLYASFTGEVGIGTTSPDATAIVEISSTTQGFLPPRMTATQASAISSPAEGLMVYVTNTNGTFTSKGWWGWNGSSWQQL